MTNPLSEITRGSRMYWLGVKWLLQHPLWIFLLFIPTLLGLVLVGVSLTVFWEYQADLVKLLLFEPGDSWVWVFAYYICRSLLYLTVLGLAFLIGLLSASVFAAPLYEYLSCAVEKEKRGGVAEVSFWRSLRLIPEELKKVLLILLLSLGLLVIPGLNILGIFLAALLVAWDVYDYPLVRRGWTLRQRLACLWADGWALLGFGVWLVIPILHLFLLPMAVAGGTLLALERVDRRERQRRDHGS